MRATPCPPTSTPQGDAPDTVLIGGGSVIVSPLGEILAGPLRDGEGILTAELDLDELARARFDLYATGHYARPDVFTLHVDGSPPNWRHRRLTGTGSATSPARVSASGSIGERGRRSILRLPPRQVGSSTPKACASTLRRPAVVGPRGDK